MAASYRPKTADIRNLLIIALLVVLLAGAILVRLVGNDQPPASVDGKNEAASSGLEATGGAESNDLQALPRSGYRAPDFALSNLDGEETSLSDWLGQPVLVNFWATWCGPCEVEMPAIEAAYQAHKEDGLVVLAVAVDDSAENVRGFAEKHNLSFQPLMDDGEVSLIYQVFGLPTSYFVRPDGTISDVHTGLLTEDTIENYLARIPTSNE
jgi:peroxiredoxin